MASNSTVVETRHDGITHAYVVVLAATSPMMLLAIIAVALRFYQQKRNLGIWWDDWASLVALIMCLGLVPSTVVCAVVSHAGYHIETYTPEELVVYAKVSSKTFQHCDAIALISDIVSRPQLPPRYYTAQAFPCPSSRSCSSTAACFPWRPRQSYTLTY